MPQPTIPLAGRYRFERRLVAHAGAERWLAFDSKTNTEVLAVVLDVQQAAAIERCVGVQHVHLAAVLEIVSKPEPEALPPGAAPTAQIAVVEYVPGLTLNRAIEKGKIQPFKAVVWFTRLVDALETLHSHGGVHEAISPRSIVIEPSGRPIAPVFTQLAMPAIGAFASPERLRGGFPTPADDVWSLHATLYAAITGVPPYLSGRREDILARIGRGKPMPLNELGVEEPELMRLLEAGLDPDRRTRVSELEELKKALDCFDRGAPLPERYRMPAVPRVKMDSRAGDGALPPVDDDGVVFDESTLPADPAATELDGTEPDGDAARLEPPPAPAAPGPPLAPPPAPAAPIPVRAARPPAPATSSNRTLIAGGAALAVVAAGGAVWWFSGTAPEHGLDAEHPSSASAAAPAARSSAPARSGPDDDRNACVASYFSDGTFDENTQFAFVCESDAIFDVSRRLYTLLRSHDPLVDGGAKDPGNGALVIRGEREAKNSPLGWYELAATAIIRQGCCKGATPPTLPKTEGWCPQLDDRVRILAEQSTTPADLSPFAKKFDDAVACLFATHTKHPYPWTAPPSDGDRSGFQQFLTHVAITDAKRSSLKRR